MRIYCLGKHETTLEEYMAPSFACFSAVGTWIDEREECEACGWHWQRIAPPLLVQWAPSSDVIGDFSWDGPFGYVFVVKHRVVRFMKANGFGARFLPVKVVPPTSKRKTKIVPFPYTGPKLTWCECNTFVNLDMRASKVALESSCPVCGDVRYTFRFKGIVIRRKEWHGEKMFRITTNGRSAATFVTEEGRRLLEDQGFTNLAFSEAGEIVK
jgi:hypothetical protein